MNRIATHALVAAAAVTAGGLGAATLTPAEDSRTAVAVRRLPPQPEQVRTVIVTKTIHRLRYVHPRPRPPAAAAAPPPVAPAAPAPASAVRPRLAVGSAPLRTRTSGGGSAHGAEGEHEGGHDD
jgi:hypothetical protein